MLDLCDRWGNTPEISPVLFGLWINNLFRGQLRKAYELGEKLLKHAQSAHDPALLLYAQLALGDTSYSMGEFALAKEQLDIPFHIDEPEPNQSLIRYGFDPRVNCLSYGALALWQLGYGDSALELGNRALALAQRLSHPFTLDFARLFAAVLREYRREARASQEHAEGVIASSSDRGFTDYLAFATTLRGRAIAQQGRHEEGIAQIREGLAMFRASGAQLRTPYFMSLMAESCIEGGHLDEGLSVLTEALAATAQHQEHAHEAETYRLIGELLLRQGSSNATEARIRFEHAVTIARKQSSKSWELRATMSLARLLRDTGRHAEARAMLAEIYGWFTEGFDTMDLKDAKALLDELSA